MKTRLYIKNNLLILLLLCVGFIAACFFAMIKPSVVSAKAHVYSSVPSQLSEIDSIDVIPENDIEIQYTLQDSLVMDSAGNWVSSGGAWDDSFSQYNCYAYAIEKTKYVSERSASFFAYQPGYFAATGEFYSGQSIYNLALIVKDDLEALGYIVSVTSVEPTNLDSNQSLICVRSGDIDYHFMRKNFDDGYWYHKPGANAILRYKYHPADKIWISEASRSGEAQLNPNIVYNSDIYYITFVKRQNSSLLQYNLINDGTAYEVLSSTKDLSGDVVIPPLYKGLRVRNIAKSGFSDCNGLLSITLSISLSSIGEGAFVGCNNLENIIVAKGNYTYRSEGKYVFRRGTNILVLACNTGVIPSYVTYIEDYAFASNGNLLSVTIPNNVASISEKVFLGCNNLTIYAEAASKPSGWNANWNATNRPVVWGCTLSTDKTYIVSFTMAASSIFNPNYYALYAPFREGYVFYGWSFSSYSTVADYTMENFVIVSNGTTLYAVWYKLAEYTLIDNGTAYAVSASTRDLSGDIVIPAYYKGIHVTSIADFSDCTGLISITLPRTVTNIGANAFARCYGLKNVTVSSGNPVYKSEGNYVLTKEDNTLILAYNTSVIPRYVTAIGDYAFAACGDLLSVMIPKSVTSMGKVVFAESGLLTLYLEKGIDTSGWDSFWNGARRPIVENCIFSTDQEPYIFYIDKMLPSVSYPDAYGGITAPQREGYYFVGWKEYSKSTVYRASDLFIAPESYLYPVWTTEPFKYTLTDSGTGYEISCMDMVILTGEVEIPSYYNGLPVTKVADYAFMDNSPANEYARTNRLTAVVLPNTITNIGNYAFAGCIKLANIELSEGIASIGSMALGNCVSLTGIVIPNSVSIIGEGAFVACNSLESVKLSDSLIAINVSTFAYTGLINIEIPASVTYIDEMAFTLCSYLESITVDSQNTMYKSDGNCIIRIADNTLVLGTKNSFIPNYVTAIGNYAFAGTEIISVSIPSSVTSIGESAFNYCYYLSDVVISPNVIYIGDNAFSDCFYLTEIIIPSSVTYIGDNAFTGCFNLTIFAEAASKPGSWSNDWNFSNYPVIWGYTF